MIIHLSTFRAVRNKTERGRRKYSIQFEMRSITRVHFSPQKKRKRKGNENNDEEKSLSVMFRARKVLPLFLLAINSNNSLNESVVLSIITFINTT